MFSAALSSGQPARRADGDACRASPIAAHSHSSGRCASRLGTRFQSELGVECPLAPFRACCGFFFKARNCVLRLLGMLWPRTDMGEAKSAQSPRNGVLAHRDTELPLYHANQIDTAPAHDAIPRQVWPLLHDRFQRRLLLLRELAWPHWRYVLDQSFYAALVEGMHPITQRLPVHAPNAGRCLPAHAIPDRS